MAFLSISQLEAAGKPLPRFASLKVSEANIRTGPSSTYPVKWVFVKKDMPIEIIAEFENWYKIRDELTNQGWVHKTLIYNKRNFIINIDKAMLYQAPSTGHRIPKARMEKGIIGHIKSCRGNWCNIAYQKHDGWIERENIWGTYPKELIS